MMAHSRIGGSSEFSVAAGVIRLDTSSGDSTHAESAHVSVLPRLRREHG